MDVNIFTNCTKYAPRVDHIRNTWKSFCDAFDHSGIPSAVFIDKNPYGGFYDRYRANIADMFPGVKIVGTNSLAEGYIRSVQESNADYLFQLEHDWQFTDAIKCTLAEIEFVMEIDQLTHMRFNKRANQHNKGWDRQLTEKNGGPFRYCLTSCVSNNPHVINRRRYRLEMLPHIKLLGGSKGIECQLSHREFVGAIYGPIGYPAALRHTDGRR
jgi:hypothetical protein